jgi:UDP-glucose 4-epimerase
MSSRVAITGASGYIGSRLVRRLESEDSVEYILAIDVVQPSTPFGTKTVFVRHDVTQPFPDLLAKHGIDTVVHTAYLLRPSHDRNFARRVNVEGTRHLLDACEAAGSRKLIYPSSTSVYGAYPDNPPLLTEDMPVRPVKDFQYSEDKVAAETLINRYAAQHPDFVATILRSPPIMGTNADNFIARAFSKPFLVKVGNADPPMQFIHEDDFLGVLVDAITNDMPRTYAAGTYNVAGNCTISWTEMCTMLGRRVITIPPTLLYPLTDLAWQLRLNRDSPACGLHFIRYPWVADTDKIKRELGIEFRYTSKEAWQAFAASASKP